LELAAKLRVDLPDVKIVILTMHKTEEYVAKALVAGVHGYVLKDNALEELIACIEAVYSGKVFLSKDVTGFVVDGFVGRLKDASAYQGDAVSAREREVLQLLAEGKSNKDISAELNLSVKTVETHRANIMRKLSLKNIADLVLYAVRNHIIEP
jgi:DNA-binding NarL/FixJ family response regulator